MLFCKKKGKLRKIAKCTYQNSIAATVDTLFSSSCLLFPLECRMLADYISWPRTNFTTTVSSVGSKHRLEFWNWFKLKMEKKYCFLETVVFLHLSPFFKIAQFWKLILKEPKIEGANEEIFLLIFSSSLKRVFLQYEAYRFSTKNILVSSLVHTNTNNHLTFH